MFHAVYFIPPCIEHSEVHPLSGDQVELGVHSVYLAAAFGGGVLHMEMAELTAGYACLALLVLLSVHALRDYWNTSVG